MIELHAYLESKRGHREMPDRADIDPAEIVRFLGHFPGMLVLPEIVRH